MKTDGWEAPVHNVGVMGYFMLVRVPRVFRELLQTLILVIFIFAEPVFNLVTYFCHFLGLEYPPNNCCNRCFAYFPFMENRFCTWMFSLSVCV